METTKAFEVSLVDEIASLDHVPTIKHRVLKRVKSSTSLTTTASKSLGVEFFNTLFLKGTVAAFCIVTVVFCFIQTYNLKSELDVVKAKCEKFSSIFDKLLENEDGHSINTKVCFNFYFAFIHNHTV